MTRGRWITPEEIPAETICRVLFIPDNLEIIASVNGALCELIYGRNWEQVGAVTPEEMAEAMATMFFAYAESECNMSVIPDIFTDSVTTNQAGGDITANADTDLFFQTENSFNPNFVTGADPNFVVQPGLYEFDIWHVVRGDAAYNAICWLANAETDAIVQEGIHVRQPALTMPQMRVVGIINVTEETEYVYRIRSSDTLATSGFGFPINISTHPEVYGQAIWRRISDPV